MRMSRIHHHLRAMTMSTTAATTSPPTTIPVRPNKTARVLDTTMAYVDWRATPSATPQLTLLALHGNPTSSYLWRKVLPNAVRFANGKITRVVAPDLVGMGMSGVSSEGYTFTSHFKYLNALLEDVIAPNERLVLLLHDWGSALGFHYASQNEPRVAGLIHLESIVAPFESWEEFPASGRKIFQAFRDKKNDGAAGEELVLQKNFFLERLLFGDLQTRKFTEEERAVYAERYLRPGESRRPMLAWPREIPIRNSPDTRSPEVIRIADDYNSLVGASEAYDKLLIQAEPGFFSGLIPAKTKHWKRHFIHPEKVKGMHFIQEDSGEVSDVWASRKHETLTSSRSKSEKSLENS